jgi:hypothetical protein
MNYLRTYLVLISAVILFLPGACGLDFSIGTSDAMNGVSEGLKLNLGVDSAFASSTVASPDCYSTRTIIEGPGELDFDHSFDSLEGGEHVRLIAKMSDSVYHVHDFAIEKQTGDRIKVSESLKVDAGKDIECSAQAWNSQGLSAKVGLKIPEGSLTDYSSYGDAEEESVTADQTAIVPKRTKFSVFSEAERKFSTQSSSSTLKSSRDMNAQTSITVTETKSKSKSILKSV